jgi:O-antigen/teichoic acid export membrane protein
MKRPCPRPRNAQTGASYSAGLVFGLGGFGAIALTTLFTSVLSARLYGITIMGQFALVLAPVGIITVLSTVREQPAMVRELAKLERRHPRVTGVFAAVFLFSFALTLVVTVLGLIASYFAFRGPLHNPGLVAPAAVGLCGYLVIINTCWNMDSVFGAFRAGRELFAVRLHQAVLYGVLWAFLCSWLAALVHRLLLLRRLVRWRVPMTQIRAGFSTLPEIVAFGLRLTPGTLAWGFSDSSGTWILGATSSVDVVGAYSRAWALAGRLSDLNWRIIEMLLPTLVQRRNAGDTDGFHRVLTDSLRYAAFGMLLPAAVGGGAANGIMNVFGAGFETADTALRFLLLLPLLESLTAIQGTALLAYDMPLLTVIPSITRLVVTLVGGVLLTLTFGLNGMAIAMAAGALASFGVYLVILRVRFGSAMAGLSHYRQIAGLGAAYGSAFALAYLLDAEVRGTLGVTLALLAGTVVYIAVGIGVAGTTDQDRARLKNAIRLTRNRLVMS